MSNDVRLTNVSHSFSISIDEYILYFHIDVEGKEEKRFNFLSNIVIYARDFSSSERIILSNPKAKALTLLDSVHCVCRLGGWMEMTRKSQNDQCV